MPKFRVTERAFTGADWSPANTLVDVGAEVTAPEGTPAGVAFELVEEGPKAKGGKKGFASEPEPAPEPDQAPDPALA